MLFTDSWPALCYWGQSVVKKIWAQSTMFTISSIKGRCRRSFEWEASGGSNPEVFKGDGGSKLGFAFILVPKNVDDHFVTKTTVSKFDFLKTFCSWCIIISPHQTLLFYKCNFWRKPLAPPTFLSGILVPGLWLSHRSGNKNNYVHLEKHIFIIKFLFGIHRWLVIPISMGGGGRGIARCPRIRYC